MEQLFESLFSMDSTDISTTPESHPLEVVSDGGLEHHEPIEQYEPMVIDVTQSVQTSSDFVNIPNPADVVNAGATGVWTNMPYTPNDDVIMVSTEQMRRMGITDQQSFDLVMTHEAMHRVLQNADAGFSSYEEELCCDYIAGVRAGLNNMDVSGMEESLAYTEASVTHPAGMNRVDSIEAGVSYAKDYLAIHNGEPPSMSECIRDFRHSVLHENSDMITLRPEENISFKGYDTLVSNNDVGDFLRCLDEKMDAIERQIELNDLDLNIDTNQNNVNESESAQYRKMNDIAFTGKNTLPPKANSDGFISDGKVTLNKTHGLGSETFKLYTKDGKEYVLYNGSYIKLSGKSTVKIGGITYDC